MEWKPDLIYILLSVMSETHYLMLPYVCLFEIIIDSY